jgi:g-D-glutamyl-meso-diaminopimelate peptidase
VPLSFPVVPTSITFTYAVLDYCVRGLKLRYPFISTGSAGKSVMGKELYYLALGSGENQVFYNAAHHGNEWITSPLLMKYIENLCDAYVSGGEIGGVDAGEIFRKSTLFFIPMVNPDGADLSSGELTSGNYFQRAQSYAGNYPAIPFPSGWKANINGVDLNLQYPAGWDNAREIKFSQGYLLPGPRDYVGTAPLTQPESRAVYNFTLARNFSLTMSYHTQGQVIFWRYLDFEPKNSYEIAQKLSQVSGYAVEETPAQSGYAGYKDWFILNYDLPGYTIEAGLGENPLPISQFDKIYSDNVGMLSLASIITAD